MVMGPWKWKLIFFFSYFCEGKHYFLLKFVDAQMGGL